MDEPAVNPYQPIALDVGSDPTKPATRRRPLWLSLLTFSLRLFGGFLVVVGLLPLVFFVCCIVGIQPYVEAWIAAAATLLYLGTGTSIFLLGHFISRGKARGATLSLAFAVMIPVVLFSLFGF